MLNKIIINHKLLVQLSPQNKIIKLLNKIIKIELVHKIHKLILILVCFHFIIHFFIFKEFYLIILIQNNIRGKSILWIKINLFYILEFQIYKEILEINIFKNWLMMVSIQYSLHKKFQDIYWQAKYLFKEKISMIYFKI